MDWPLALLLLVGGVMVLIALGTPVAVSFIAVNFVGAYFFLGSEAGLLQLTRNMVNSVTNFAFTPIPMFLLMGDLLFHTGLAIKAIDAVSLVIRRVPARLSASCWASSSWRCCSACPSPSPSSSQTSSAP